MIDSGTLVIGGNGFVGGEIVAALREVGENVVATYHERPIPYAQVEFDFWIDDLGALLDEHDIETVIFAATVERGYDESMDRFDQIVSRVLTDCHDRRFVYLSSDAVFSGADGLYNENDSREPATDYGRRLVAFEDSIRQSHEDYCIVRPGYVFGFSRGELDPRLAATKERLQADESVEYFEDMFKSPVSVSELARVIRILTVADHTGIIHGGGPRTSVYGFHCNGMEGLGISSDQIIPTTIPDRMNVPPDLSLASERLTTRTEIELTPVCEAIHQEADRI